MQLHKLLDLEEQDRIRTLMGRAAMEKNLNQQQLAQAVGISDPSMNRFMYKRTKAGANVMRKMVYFLLKSGYDLE